MKSTGIVRQMDNLGRIVIPIEMRRVFDIDPKDLLEIYVEGDQIILKKYDRACSFCGGNDGVTEFNGKNICKHCIADIKATL